MDESVIFSDALSAAVKEMIEKVRTNVDMDKLRTILEQYYGLETIESINFSDGELVSENQQPALKLDYQVTIKVPLYFDLKGNFLAQEYEEEEEEEPEQEMGAEQESDLFQENVENAGFQAGEQTQNF